MTAGGAGGVAAAVASVLMFATTLQAVSIERLSVPAQVELDTREPFLLDCQYRIADTADLSVEWHFKPTEVNIGGGRRAGGSSSELVYRHTPPHAPEVFGVLRDKIEARTDDEPMRSQLRVTQPDVRLSGEYTCVVSSAGASARATRTLLVYSGEHDLRLEARRRDREGLLDLSCSVDKVYPEPDLRLERLDSSNSSIQLPQGQRIQPSVSGSGLLSALTTAQLNMNELGNQERFVCRLSLKHTSYQARSELNFKTRSADMKNGELSVTTQPYAPSTSKRSADMKNGELSVTTQAPAPSNNKNGAAQLKSLSAVVTVLSVAATMLLALARI